MMYMPLSPTRWKAAVSSARNSRNWRSRLTNGTCMTSALSTVEPSDQLGDTLLLRAGDELVHRQRQDRAHNALAHREVAGLVAELPGRGLQVHRDRVVHLRV